MARSRRSYKKTRPVVRVGLKKRKSKLLHPQPVCLPGSDERLEWNDKGTVLDNYRSLGIVRNPNVTGARSGSGKNVQLVSLQKPLSAEPETEEYDSDKESDELRSALGKKRKDGRTAPLQRLTKMQRVYVSRLIAKHGDNYEAMWRDMKLNKMQQPPAALRSLCVRYHAYEKNVVGSFDSLEIKDGISDSYCQLQIPTPTRAHYSVPSPLNIPSPFDVSNDKQFRNLWLHCA